MTKKLSYDERQTAACNAVRERLMSVISQSHEALNCIGSDKCLDLLDDIKTDAAFAMDTCNAIVMDKI